MRKLTLVVAGALALGACGGEPKLENDIDRAAYAAGYNAGEFVLQNIPGIDVETFIAGMRARINEEEPLLSAEERSEAIAAYYRIRREQVAADQQELAEENAAAGQAFREEYARKEGVQTLEDGILYEVLASGKDDAVSPKPDDTVVVHYHGTLTDGTVFDSSVERGEPATFPLRRVIEGWQKALVHMKVGDKWRVVIPPELAYGERSASDKIGPNATLIFEIELLDIGLKLKKES